MISKMSRSGRHRLGVFYAACAICMRDPIKDAAALAGGVAVNARLRTLVRSQPNRARRCGRVTLKRCAGCGNEIEFGVRRAFEACPDGLFLNARS
jgi:hypothetical protein